jgi:hypothetical protein
MKGRQMDSHAEYQLVLVLWGTKYGIDEVSHLIRIVKSHSRTNPRVVLITDRPRQGLDADVIQRPFPEFFLKPEFKGPGCQAKLAMFDQGVLPDDLPSVFLDLDSVVMGDLQEFLMLQDTPQTVALFQSAMIPIGVIGRFLWKFTKGRKYGRGNSSMIIFHPRECGFIASRFRALFDEHNGMNFRPMIADERFICWAAQPYMRAIPRTMAVKFPTEFMVPWRWLIYLRSALPWNRRRWAKLLVVTLPGAEVKGEELLHLPDGAEVVDRKGRKLIWSDRILGPIRGKIIKQYQTLEDNLQVKDTP